MIKNSNIYDNIISPIVTEKSTNQSELNKIVFKVNKNFNKNNIKKNIEKIFKVNVTKVNIVNKKTKIVIKLGDGSEREIEHSMDTLFYSPEGSPMTAKEFVEHLFGQIPELFNNESELRQLWANPTTRRSLLERLTEKGFGDAELKEMQRLVNAEKSDLYDVLMELFPKFLETLPDEKHRLFLKYTKDVFAYMHKSYGPSLYRAPLHARLDAFVDGPITFI